MVELVNTVETIDAVPHNSAARRKLYAARVKIHPKRASGYFRNLKWLKPVFAGDTVTYTMRFNGSRPVPNRPGRSLVDISYAGVNQNGEQVFSMDGSVVEFD